MEGSKEIFKKNLVNDFMSKVGGEKTSSLMQDMNKFTKEMKEAENLKVVLETKKH